MGKLFFINYLLYRPHLPNVSGKYEMLSDEYSGDMVAICPKESDGIMLGAFRFHAIPFSGTPVLRQLIFMWHVIRIGLASHRRQRIDCIIAYDPLLCGACGYLLRFLTGARLVLEVNGDIIHAGFLAPSGFGGRMKQHAVRTCTRFLLRRADAIKYLNDDLASGYSSFVPNMRYHAFIDFVPTYAYRDGPKDFNKSVLFVGYPFYLKGVDILIKAFQIVSPRHPEFTLKIIGHCPDPAPFLDLIGENPRIVIEKAVFYDDIIAEFKKCYVLVLPSRSEGMGRVLIEAMASGKPVIGSNVGGIPSIIRDGETGFLFQSENHADLAEKLELLMSDEALARRMGDAGFAAVERELSASVYIDWFKGMIRSVCGAGEGVRND